jgi:exodeoxyribonuclease V alpha subunit
VYNGDIGRIVGIDFANQKVHVTFDERVVDYTFNEMQEVLHAFAVSVHRSQGSEYPVVVVPVMMQHFMMLQRNLLYTAVTRAKQLVVLVGSRKAVALAVRNDKVAQRYTALAWRLAKAR